MKIPFGIALALHAAAAAGVVAFGVPGGSSERPSVGGQTIEIDQIASPTIHEDLAQVPEIKTASHEVASRGAPEAVHLLARSTSAAAAATGDVVPQPQPTQAAPTHFTMVASNITLSARLGSPTGNVSAPPQTIAAAEEVVADSDVTERARQVGGTSPVYPSDARAQGVELGSPLPFEIVVDSSGRVASARALHHAGYGFDEAAMTALRTYRFTPATRAGHVVPVRMRWTVDFRLN